MNQKTLRLIFACLLVAIGIAGRLFIHTPNVETVTVVTLLAGMLLGGTYAWAVPLVVVGLSDMVLGNDLILLYTWSAWVGIGLLSKVLRGAGKSIFTQTFMLTGAGVASTVIFYLWTNFGVWQMSGMYPHTGMGLLASYVMGLPFLKFQLLGNLMLVPVVSLVVLGAWKAVHALQPAAQTAATQPTADQLM
jgi:hypothetical protein